jgi:hypothetical protein
MKFRLQGLKDNWNEEYVPVLKHHDRETYSRHGGKTSSIPDLVIPPVEVMGSDVRPKS